MLADTDKNKNETFEENNFFFIILFKQSKSKEKSFSNGHGSATTTKSGTEQTSISFSNDTESIKKQEPKKQVNIVISYIEQNDEQGITQLVKLFKSQILL